MSNARQNGAGGLEVFANTVKTASAKQEPAPVHLWNPPSCGDIGMRIAADGTWYYRDTPIGRPAMVQLFASILKREGDEYFLVTPVEKCGITVEDAPFMAVELHVSKEDGGNRELQFRTNVDDWVTCGPGHPLRFKTDERTADMRPYVHIRSGLWARVVRAIWYDLVELGEKRNIDGVEMFGVASAGEFYAMAPTASLNDVAR